MIKVYLDWSVISNLKKDGNLLNATMEKYKSHLLIPYNSTHFIDLMKSYSLDNKEFFQDLEMLEYLCSDNYMEWVDNDGILFFPIFPKEYFKQRLQSDNANVVVHNNENIEQLDIQKGGYLRKAMDDILLGKYDNIDKNDINYRVYKMIFPSMDSNPTEEGLVNDYSSFIKKLKSDGAFLDEFMKTIGEDGFKIKSHVGDLPPENIWNEFDKFLKLQMGISFMEYINLSSRKNILKSRLIQFVEKYMLLGTLGYKPEKRNKPTVNFGNTFADATHAFHAMYCNYFIVEDTRLNSKSKVLYHQYGINTKVLTPTEFIQEIEMIEREGRL